MVVATIDRSKPKKGEKVDKSNFPKLFINFFNTPICAFQPQWFHHHKKNAFSFLHLWGSTLNSIEYSCVRLEKRRSLEKLKSLCVTSPHYRNQKKKKINHFPNAPSPKQNKWNFILIFFCCVPNEEPPIFFPNFFFFPPTFFFFFFYLPLNVRFLREEVILVAVLDLVVTIFFPFSRLKFLSFVNHQIRHSNQGKKNR